MSEAQVYPEHPASQVSVPGAVRERLRGTERKTTHRHLGAVSLDTTGIRGEEQQKGMYNFSTGISIIYIKDNGEKETFF